MIEPLKINDLEGKRYEDVMRSIILKLNEVVEAVNDKNRPEVPQPPDGPDKNQL